VSESRSDSCEIAVVGGGVIGAACALALHRAGFDVRLLERGSPPPAFDASTYDPRVYAISPASARFLDSLGAWAGVRARRACAYERMEVWNLAPRQALGFDAAQAGVPDLGWIVEQSVLLAALWQALPQERVWAGSAVESLSLPAQGGAVLHLAEGGALRTHLVVSAEGRNARLREQAGLGIAAWSYRQTALVSHIETEVPHHMAALQRFLPGGPLAFLPLADGRRSIVWSVPDARLDALLELAPEAFCTLLEQTAQGRVGRVLGMTAIARFPLRAMHAQRYVRPGFAVIGDSAHVVHPLAGQGANLGFGDAEELVATLVEARARGADWGGERALRHYERARRSANLEMLALTDALNRAFRTDSALINRLLSIGLSGVDHFTLAKRWLARRALG
jgi:ubiquinone biosynthesis UbiH/UbiF/VisC/COQ6 family hydroxylase